MISQFSQLRLDGNFRPQDDFFRHVNNIWLEENPIPDSESRWGVFGVLREDAWSKVRDIYEGLQDKEAKDTTSQQAKDFYYTGINFDSFAARHMKIVDEYLARIDATFTPNHFRDCWRVTSHRPRRSMAIYIDTDESDSSQYTLRLYQSGLSLPDKDYYLSDDKSMKQTRKNMSFAR